MMVGIANAGGLFWSLVLRLFMCPCSRRCVCAQVSGPLPNVKGRFLFIRDDAIRFSPDV